MPAAAEGATSATELEAWVREELAVPPEASVQISEQPGTDPRCSPVVTEVAIAAPGEAPYAFHIERALRETTRMDLIAALAFGGGH
ncbi:MAG: hypothetical protein M3N68_10905 [Actinomycetota bacterium]|nr:hypothetical protein [Actinomycetota bacterium]